MNAAVEHFDRLVHQRSQRMPGVLVARRYDFNLGRGRANRQGPSASAQRNGTGDKRPINISRLNLRDKKINRFLEPSLPPCFLMSTLFGADTASIEFSEQVR